MNNTLKPHISILDSLRAFAALSVCLFHFVCTTTGYISDEFVISFFSVGKYGVQLFFVISGFVIPWAMYHAKFKITDFFHFFMKRLIRLEPPYVVSLITVLVILYFRSILIPLSNEQIHPSLPQVLLHFGYMIPFFDNYTWLNNVYWTLAVEFQYYILIALIFIPITQSKLVVRILFYISLIVASYLTKSAFLPHWMPFFGLGIILFLFFSNLISKKEYYVVTSVLVVFCIYKYPIAMVLFALIPVMMLIFCKDLKVIGLDFIGKFSYSIYLFHPLLGSTFINIMSHHYTSPTAKCLVIFTGFIITILGSWLTYILIEKPSKRLSANIKYKE